MQKIVAVFVVALTSYGMFHSPALAHAQDPPEGEWLAVAPVLTAEEEPVRVTVQELKSDATLYRERAIIVSGTLHVQGEDAIDTPGGYRGLNYEIRDGVVVLPILFVSRKLDRQLEERLEAMNGRMVEVLGRFGSLGSSDPTEMPGEARRSRTEGIVIDSLRETGVEETQDDTPETSAKDVHEPPSPGRRRPVPTLESSYPRTGTYGIPLGTEFRLTFSTDMDAESFEDNVHLTYMRDQDEVPLELRYEDESRTLRVKPREDLRPLAELRLSLHRGIVSREGAPLVVLMTDSTPLQSRRSAATSVSDAVVVLKYSTRGYD